MAAALPETMLAFRMDGSNPAKHPTKATVPVPKEIGPDEVLIKVEAAGLCHSDLHLYDSPDIGAMFPNSFTLGHEGCGTVGASLLLLFHVSPD
jgi:propanol-preferring alcohol dehydrogenase